MLLVCWCLHSFDLQSNGLCGICCCATAWLVYSSLPAPYRMAAVQWDGRRTTWHRLALCLPGSYCYTALCAGGPRGAGGCAPHAGAAVPAPPQGGGRAGHAAAGGDAHL